MPLAPDDRPIYAASAAGPALLVGVGCTRGAPAEALASAATAILHAAGLAPEAVRLVATARRKIDEPALRQWAEALGVPLMCFDDAALAAQNVATPSARVQQAIGLVSVAEAAALAAAERTELLLTRRSAALPGGHHLTLAVAREAEVA